MVVAPRELEEAAQGAAGVRLAAAIGVAAATGHAEIITVVVEADVAGRSAELIAADVSKRIVDAAGFAPGRVAVVPSRTVPRTENGKIRHDRLRAAVLDGLLD